jgi:hypothetical protein
MSMAASSHGREGSVKHDHNPLPHPESMRTMRAMPSPQETVRLSLLDAVLPGDGLDPDRLALLGREARKLGAARLAVCDLGPALAGAGLAYASAEARVAATHLLATLGRAAQLPLLAPGPDMAAPGAEAAGLAPLPALVLQTGHGRALSRAVALAVPHELLAATRLALLGHGALPAFLKLDAATRAAIAALLPQATSLAHAAALADCLAALDGIDPATMARAEAHAFGTDAPPDFLPEAVATALTPGASAAALAAMAEACRPLLAEAPYLPSPSEAAATPLPRAPRRAGPAPLPLFPDAPAQPAPAAARGKNLRLVG